MQLTLSELLKSNIFNNPWRIDKNHFEIDSEKKHLKMKQSIKKKDLVQASA